MGIPGFQTIMLPLLRSVADGRNHALREAALAELMIDHNVGVAPAETYVVKEVDQDCFQEE